MQTTFTIIPRGTGAGADLAAQQPPAIPMTSKQVRKAYQAAKKAPILTREERRKEEREEQARIRKELEKERSAAKAKAARDKKRLKEAAEIEEKKRNRLPLVNVRPSQDTISRFVRGNGTANKRDAQGQSVKEKPQEVERRAAVVENTVDNAGQSTEQVDDQNKEIPAQNAESAVLETQLGLDLIPEEEDFGMEMLEELDAFESNSPIDANRVEPPDRPPESQAKRQKQSSLETDSKIEPKTNGFQPQTASQPKSNTDMAPPNPPSSPQALEENNEPTTLYQFPPMSTQAILCNPEDFFPTSSQQARELEDDIISLQSPAKPTPEVESIPKTNPLVAAAAPPPKRFFTSSGSNERLSLALHRSRRTAAMEELYEQERIRRQVREIEQLERESPTKQQPSSRALSQRSRPQSNRKTNLQTAIPHAPSVAFVKPQAKPPEACRAQQEKDVAFVTKMKSPQLACLDKENLMPELDDLSWPSESQETDYGGEWMDDMTASQIMM